MLENKTFFEKLLSLLQGAAWALAVVGAVIFFINLYHIGIITALLGAFLGSLIGLFFVVLFEMAQIQLDTLGEVKKQTKLLEKLLEDKS